MFRILLFIVAILFACCGQAQAESACVLKTGGAAGSQTYMPFPAVLKHGINLSRWWEDAQDNALSAEDIHRIHDMGFDFVRLPVSPLWLDMADHDQQAKKLDQLRCDIISLLNEGLTVIVDMHPSETYKIMLARHPEDVIPHIEKIWNQMQPVLAELPSWRIYLGLLDEPLIESASWWRMQGKIIDDLRPVFPGTIFIASSGPFNGWWDLTDRTPYKDQDVVYDFHFYEPIIFTHHGGENPQSANQEKPPSPIVYPVDKAFAFDITDPEIQKYVAQGWNRTSLTVILKEITAWRDHYNALIVCLEFGVYRPSVDDRSRYNWLRDARETLDDMNIPWALWEYRGPFGIINSQGVLDPGMIEALNLKKSSP